MSLLLLAKNRIKEAIVTPPPSGWVEGPGPNAPSWVGKTTYTTQRFATPIPVNPSAEVDGFLAFQGFGGSYNRVTYPTVDTPTGDAPVLRIAYNGQTENLSALDAATTMWPFASTEYSDAGIRVTGTWSGTLEFERSTDGGSSWSSYNVTRISNATSVSSTTTNGTFRATTGATTEHIRVRASSWVSGTAIVSVGMAGGQAPARFTSGRFAAGQTKIYFRIWVRGSENFVQNGNVGTKLTFYRKLDGDNHYVDFGGEGTFAPRIKLQPERSTPTALPITGALGVWNDLEVLIEANTPGVANGIAKIWLNNTLLDDRSDYIHFDTGDTVVFTGLFTDPTYGGGVNPPPEDMYMEFSHYYWESAA